MCFFQIMKKLVFTPVLLMMMVANALAVDHFSTSPLRVWGDFSTIYRTREFNGGENSVSNWLNIGRFNAGSYIWRPWFALVRGGLSLSVDENKFNGQEPVTNEFVTGNLQFDLFPTSRFPFKLYYDQSRNEPDDNLFSRDITTTEYGFIQQYRSMNGKHHYRADYKQKTREENELDGLDGLSLTFSSSNNFIKHSLNTDIQIDTIVNEQQNEGADSYSVTGRHSYNGGNNFSIENLVSTSLVENDFVDSVSDVKTAQISSFLSWHPESRKDINLTGSFRLSDLELRQSQNVTTPLVEPVETGNATANINQGLVYEYSDNLLFRETLNANYVESQNQHQFSGNESIGLIYTPDRKAKGTRDYGWSIASTINNQHGDVESQQSLDNRFSHSLTHNFSVANRYELRTSLTQLIEYDYQTSSVDKMGLDHSFSVTWSELAGNNQSAVRFLISDSRSQEIEDKVFQLANLQYSGFIRFNRYSRMSGNITLQTTNQKDGTDKNRRTVSNGRLEFSRDRVFQIPRLVFRSELQLSRQQSENERLISQLDDSSVDRSAWKNSLNYKIGRLEARLNLDFIESDGEYDRLIKIQLTRSFGDL